MTRGGGAWIATLRIRWKRRPEAIGFHRNYVPLICLVGGLMGLAAMFLMETWVSVLAYPLNIAGRPLFSWPALTSRLMSGPSCGRVFPLLSGCWRCAGCRRYITRFSTLLNFRNGATVDKFFLCLEANDPSVFELVESRTFLGRLPAGFGSGGGVLIPQPKFVAEPGLLRVGSLWG